LVPKDELLGRVWPNLVVEENDLQVQVSTLRWILAADAIATTADRGYRFTLALTAAGESSSAPVARRHNLPHDVTGFIGHEDDLDECTVLREQTRLLTLTGIAS
jgi:DNA-binding winged helix-turn-helix (wHTH) protein